MTRSNLSPSANTAERGRHCQSWTVSVLPGSTSARSCCAGGTTLIRRRLFTSRSSRSHRTTRKPTGHLFSAATESNMSKTRQVISVCRRSTACNLARFWRTRTIFLRFRTPMTSRRLSTLRKPRRLNRFRRVIWRFPSGKSRLTYLFATKKPTTTGGGQWILCWRTISITS